MDQKIVRKCCMNTCHLDSFFCYKHCKMYGLETESGFIDSAYSKIKKFFWPKNRIESIRKCTYNDADFNCGICDEKYSQMNPLVFMRCCKLKQIACMQCLSNILIEYYISKYYQHLLYNHYLFYLYSKTSFQCPYCRQYTSIRQLKIDSAIFIYNIEQNVVRKLERFQGQSNYDNIIVAPPFP